MNNKKIILSSILLSTGLCLTGCEEKAQDFIDDLKLTKEDFDLENIELLEYKELELKDINDGNTNEHSLNGYHAIKFNSKSSNYFITDERLLNDDEFNIGKLFNYQTLIHNDSGVYFKDYEFKPNTYNGRSIKVYEEEVSFNSYSYNNKENALKLFLTLENEIRETLQDVLLEENIDEITKFIKNEVYKSKNVDENYTSIKISDKILLTYSFNYYEDGNYSTTSLNLKNI